MTSRQALALTLVLGTSLLTACNQSDSNAAATPTNAQASAGDGNVQNLPARPVRYLVAGLENVSDNSQLPGELRPRHEQHYGFRVGGKIQQRLVEIGQTVKAGQTLAVLDAQDVQPAIDSQAAQLDVAKADLALQESELRRQQELRDKGFVSGAALERQQATTESARARLKAAQSQLANARNGRDFQTLRADQDGVVVGIDADAGSVVSSGQSVVRVAQLGEKEVLIQVPERAVAAIRKATGFTVSADANPGKTYTAQLRELAPAADPASRTYAARLRITQADDALQLGMSASVQLNYGESAVIVVPNSALYTRDNATKVWLIDRASNTVKPVAVVLGASTPDGVTITAGLKAGDLVVTAGANLLLPGQKVKLLEADKS